MNSAPNHAPAQMIRKRNTLKNKLGGLSNRDGSIAPETIAKIEKALQEKTEVLRDRFIEDVKRIRELGRTRETGWLTAAHDGAHNLRGLGTTFGYPLISRLAHDLCLYFEALSSSEAAESVLVMSYLDAILSAALAGQAANPIGDTLQNELRKLALDDARRKTPRGNTDS